MTDTIVELQSRIEKLEAEMFSRGFWQRPAPQPKEYPEVDAIVKDWIDESCGMVTVVFDYPCAVCHEQYSSVLRVPKHEANPFNRLLPCEKTDDQEHVTRVIFRRDH